MLLLCLYLEESYSFIIRKEQSLLYRIKKNRLYFLEGLKELSVNILF
jgi:hypothetical protein